MSVDLDKNRSHILQVYNDLLDEKSDTDWALLGYEGQTNIIKVVSYGEDGLEELAEDLNASKVMYAVVRVTDPKTSRPKIVLINWVGEGAPNIRKGMCARHLPDVKRFLKGVHITVSARNEDEVEFAVIMNAVSKASATDYNFQNRSEMPERNAPVGTNYKRTNPLSELNSNSRNKFWEEQEAEEKTRKEEELKRREEEAKKLERQRLEREEKEAKHRAQLDRERNARIATEKKAEMEATQRSTKENTQQQWKQHLADSHLDELERIRRADNMRMERKKEAEGLIGNKTHQTRSMFEVQSSTRDFNAPSHNSKNRPPPRVLKDFPPQNVVDAPSINSTKSEDSVPKRVGARWPPPSQEENVSHQATVGRIADWKPANDPGPYREGEQKLIQRQFSNSQNHVQEANAVKSSSVQSNSAVPTSSPQNSYSTNHITAPTPEAVSNSTSIIVQDAVSPEPSKNHIEEPYSNGVKEPEVYNHDNPLQADSADLSMIYEVDGVEYQLLPEHGLCARALYDYQAADETEITFDPGDIITGIDQIDVGWWQGVSPHGVYGLFPANYVELINGDRVH